jgi:hypothetical protein
VSSLTEIGPLGFARLVRHVTVDLFGVTLFGFLRHFHMSNHCTGFHAEWLKRRGFAQEGAFWGLIDKKFVQRDFFFQIPVVGNRRKISTADQTKSVSMNEVVMPFRSVMPLAAEVVISNCQ